MSINIPKQLKCKLCNKKFNNPLYEGARVSASICTPCRHGYFSAKTLRQLNVDRSKEEFTQRKEEIKTKLTKEVTTTNNNYITLATYEDL